MNNLQIPTSFWRPKIKEIQKKSGNQKNSRIF
nr:MAG TPA: hypothetical protein [Caudoviricetes sp.]